MEVTEVLNKVEKALEKDLCDHCLGRLFAQLGHGVTNIERGKSIRIASAMLDPEEEKKEVPGEGESCELCKNLFDELDKFAELSSEELKPFEFEDFLIGSRIDPEIEEKEEALWTELNLTTAEPIKSEINREVGKRVQEKIEKEVDLKDPDIKAIVDTRFDAVEIEISPLFIYGRYKKLERGIPQTRWVCKRCRGKGCEKCNGTGKLYETSVEEIIGTPLKEMTSGEDFTLHGMGREDIDAKMLGNGRPFVMEVTDPKKRDIDLERFRERVAEDERVNVRSLEPTKKEKVQEIKQAKADKTYEVTIRLEETIGRTKFKKVLDELSGVKISQRTPVRVSHRRSDRIRKRRIKGLELKTVDNHAAVLEMTCEAGTYVKEFIHGDEGRTKPNLSEELGTRCEVKKLDVTYIHYPEGCDKDEEIERD
ncbi:MAG: tRNA pseudouridine(54/55) synthase Pus10 [Candidatus Natronoplasma sp.]